MIDAGEKIIIEGPSFDREGNLFITAPSHGLVFKITPRKQVSTVFSNHEIITCGSAFHRDGRLFVGCLSGELLIINSDSSHTFLRPTYHGKRLSINDLVFDRQGNIYVTDFNGTAVEPTGGVYRLSVDGLTVQPVLLHLASPNGVSLSPEGKVLWVGETTRNTILRIELMLDGITPAPVDGVTCVYYSSGFPGPDSNRVDSKGNLYQCIMGQGRVVILNPVGIPVANIIVEGRDEGKTLRTANLAFKPGTDEGYLVTSGKAGAWICKFKGLAQGLRLFSHAR